MEFLTRAKVIIRKIIKNIIENVNRVGAYLSAELAKLVEEYDCIETSRGVGLMQGLVFTCPVAPFIQKSLEAGLVLINAGEKIIRFIPPLVITKEHVDEMIMILSSCLDEV